VLDGLYRCYTAAIEAERLLLAHSLDATFLLLCLPHFCLFLLERVQKSPFSTHFRREIRSIDIVTFDELLERAQFIARS
jgi:hypothetical protein